MGEKFLSLTFTKYSLMLISMDQWRFHSFKQTCTYLHLSVHFDTYYLLKTLKLEKELHRLCWRGGYLIWWVLIALIICWGWHKIMFPTAALGIPKFLIIFSSNSISNSVSFVFIRKKQSPCHIAFLSFQVPSTSKVDAVWCGKDYFISNSNSPWAYKINCSSF